VLPSINFYHLTTTSLENALPKLLEKAFSGGYRVLVLAENDARVEQLNTHLWTYDEHSFLPHGSASEAYGHAQPILLSTSPEVPNNANLLLVTDGRIFDANNKNFERVLDVFDGNDASATASARARWKNYKDAGYEISYFKQTPQGGWQKNA